MKRFATVLYSIALAGVICLTVAGTCEFCGEDITARYTMVICDNGTPTLVDENRDPIGDASFKPSDYECPKDNGESPLWANSHKPVTKPFSTISSASDKVRAATGSTVTYIPQLLLSLPFVPRETPATSRACDPNEPDVIAVNHSNSLVTRLSTCPFALKKSIRVGSRPLQIAITPDGQTAIVTCFDNVISFIDLNTNAVTATMNVSFYPHGISVTSDGKTAYVSSFDNQIAIIAVVDIASHTVTKTFSTPAYPQSVFLSPDDTQLYIVFPFTNALYIMDTMTGVVGNTFAIPTPRSVAFNSQGTKAYIASATGGSSGSVYQLDTETFKVEKIYQVGAGPTDIAVVYGDTIVVTSNFEGASVSTIDLRAGTVATTVRKGNVVGLAIIK